MDASDPGVESNARLTASVGLVLLVLLAIEFLSGLSIRGSLLLHIRLGVFVIPPLLLKLGTTGYRFARYYTREPRYRAAGTPSLAMRILAPFLVALTVVVFASGVELWLFGERFGFFWVPLHHGSAYLWFAAATIHVGNYIRRAPQLALADWQDHLKGVFTRRSVVVASLVFGAVLAIAVLGIPSAFVVRPGA